MPVLTRALVLTLLTLGLNAIDAQPAKLVGSWEMEFTEPDVAETPALNAVLTFGADGSLRFRFNAPDYDDEQPADRTYTADADTITAIIDGVEHPARYWFDNGDLYIDDQGLVLRLRRKSGY